MDNRTKKIQHIRSTFKNIRRTEVKEAVAALLDLLAINSLLEFIPIMRECIHLNRRDPYIWKYFAYFDSFLSHPQFVQMIHMCLLQFYASIVLQLHRHGAISEVEHAKIYRKYWVGRIHPGLYADLKKIVYRQTGIDIDYITSVDAVQNIRNYYTHVLRLPPQEILYFLPQTQPVINNYFSSFCLPNQTHGIYQNYHLLDTSREKYSKPEQQIKNIVSPSPTGSNKNKFQNNSIAFVNTAISQSSDLNVYHNNSSKNQPLPNFLQGKRLRYQSEQTNAGTVDDIKQYEQIRKVRRVQPPQPSFNKNNVQVHNKKEQANEPQCDEPQSKENDLNYEEQIRKAREMRQQLNSLNKYECKECGLRFECQQNLKEHTQNHVKQRLTVFQSKQDIKFGLKTNPFALLASYFKTANRWEKEKDSGVQQQTYWMATSSFLKNDDRAIDCAFCGDKIEQQFVNDEWKFKNVVNTIINTSDDSTELSISDKTQKSNDEQGQSNTEKKPKIEKSKKCVLHLSCAQVLKKDAKNVESWNVAYQ